MYTLLFSAFVLVLALMSPSVASAQISLPNTFTPGTRIYSAQVNADLQAVAGDALNRTGGTLTGNILASAGVTVDGVDLSVGIPVNVLAKSATYTVTTSDTADCAVLCTGTFTVNLYTAAGNTGRRVTVKNVSTGVITVDANGAETIDGSLTQVIAQRYQALTMVSDGTNWVVV